MLRPDEGLIHACLDGELDAAEAERVARLVAEDAEWGAAAAEARGLIAASSRILDALDEVPGDVIPMGSRAAQVPAVSDRTAGRVPKARSTVRPWMRIAAAMVLVVGTAYVASETWRDVPPTPTAIMDHVSTPPPATRAESELRERSARGDAAELKVAAAPPSAGPPTDSASPATAPPFVAATSVASSSVVAPPVAPSPVAAPSVAEPAVAAGGLGAVAAGAASQPTREAGGVASERATAINRRTALAPQRTLDAPASLEPSAAKAFADALPSVVDGCWRTATAARADTVLIAPRIVRLRGDSLVIGTGDAAREAQVRRIGADTLRGVMRNSAGTSVPFEAVRVSCPRAP